MTRPYDYLRNSLNDGTLAMDKVFVRLALQWDGMTASIVTMAALNIPKDRAADLIGREPDEIDALVTLFNADVSRSIKREREIRDMGSADDAA